MQSAAQLLDREIRRSEEGVMRRQSGTNVESSSPIPGSRLLQLTGEAVVCRYPGAICKSSDAHQRREPEREIRFRDARR